MSHHHRKDKTCLNCGAVVPKVYCTVCGQENNEPKQTLWHLITHFFQDVTHFDGKFFSTMKYLLVKPGFLSSEYIKGRRVKYLDPIRMYLFISAVFFLLSPLFSFHADNITMQDRAAMTYVDSLRIAEDNNSVSFTMVSMPESDKLVSIFTLPYDIEHGVAHYDSVQHTLPESQRDNIAWRYLCHRGAVAYQAYLNDPYNFVPNVVNAFFHAISKIFFISLPLFALILYLLYVRRKTDKYYYVSHAIFAIHYYSISFIFIFLALLSVKLFFITTFMNDAAMQVIVYLAIGGLFAYLYVAMLRFYRQGWFKTFIKFLFLSFSTVTLVLFISFLLFLNSLSGLI